MGEGRWDSYVRVFFKTILCLYRRNKDEVFSMVEGLFSLDLQGHPSPQGRSRAWAAGQGRSTPIAET